MKLLHRLLAQFRRRPSSAGQYRIVRRGRGFEPQMSYSAGIAEGLFWYPLNSDGYWLEPDAFTNGNVTMHISMTRDEASRAVLRAGAIEGAHIRAA